MLSFETFMRSTRAPLSEPARPAKRRRERRLRQFLRHERLTVAMVLSEKEHHTSRSQRKDRTRGEEYATHCTAKVRKTKAAATVYYPLADDEGGRRGSGPQAHVFHVKVDSDPVRTENLVIISTRLCILHWCLCDSPRWQVGRIRTFYT